MVARLSFLPLLACAGLSTALAPPAGAETQARVLFSHKHWEVSAVMFDDGTPSCVAEVHDGPDSFSVWVSPEVGVKLQFYSDDWEFGDGSSADLEVQIDRRSPWSLTNAELYKQSVLFTLPDGKDSERFLGEVMGGNRLYLRNDAGDDVIDYSLAGSSASIVALTECADAMATVGQGQAERSPSNPFN